MSEGERTGIRFDTYSMWHRSKSISRFNSNGRYWGMIDFDYVEYVTMYNDRYPVIFKEITTDMTATKEKVISVTRNTLRYHPVNLPFLIVHTKLTAENMPAKFQTLENGCEHMDIKDIEEFYVTQYNFKKSIEPVFKNKLFKSLEFTNLLAKLRDESKDRWVFYLTNKT